MSDLGDRLYRTVVDYCALGEHRSGTEVDRRTIDWMAAELARIPGTVVERHPYTFPRYDARWSVHVDDEPVESIPLFYEGAGTLRSRRPVTAAVRVAAGSFVPDLEPIAKQAVADGRDAAVIATVALGGPLQAVNRTPPPAGKASGLPTLCVAESLAPRLAQARVEVELDARIVAGESANLLARVGPGPDARRVLLTTPLSGWFQCAGERGTGIAVCLEVAHALATDGVPLLIAVNNGHELMGYGARLHLAAGIEARGIFHFGASVASGERDASGQLSRLARGVRLAGTLLREGDRALLEQAFAPLGRRVEVPTEAQRRDPGWWRGESRAYSAAGLPLVSMAGGHYLHHAPQDTPENATTPQLLETSFRCALAAARLLATA
jgi:hypothetical protein